ncbi:TetR/AcrR family transcriptional regulator [Methylocystis rosea]|uniref:TetR/AcrR family transcriptional regulator n=1 Tax=Methylocystis rosea TaxID=173366 RepID=A0ABX6EN96_9HYPH|nr:TetR/AcrR family transcriptional regulator [Methylocystis rosea]QGM95370.1 TetR/AcrR family transcriptional regulator [Methylocystis rosea]
MTSHKLTSLRETHKDHTRTRILEAAIDEMREGKLDALTIAKVAERAQVTERTVYRHFLTREDLLKAVWPRMQARVGSSGFPQTADDLIATPLRLFPRFDEEEGLIRASISSEPGREMRLSSNPQRQAAMLACVADALPEMDDAAKRRRAAVAQLIDSAYAWSVLRDFWGLEGAEAGRAASEAIAVLLGRRSAADERDLSPERVFSHGEEK